MDVHLFIWLYIIFFLQTSGVAPCWTIKRNWPKDSEAMITLVRTSHAVNLKNSNTLRSCSSADHSWYTVIKVLNTQLAISLYSTYWNFKKSIFIRKILHVMKKEIVHWGIEWLSLGLQLARLKYLLTDCFLAELHQLWHQPGTQKETLVSTILSVATATAQHPAGCSQISW